MNSPALVATSSQSAPAQVSPKWRQVVLGLIGLGGLLGLVGALTNTQQFAYSYLLAFMFFLSLCLGALFLVLIHHLFDASWSVPIRRVAEHLAFLLPVMAALFIPIALLAPSHIYPWMQGDPHLDHALHAKQPLFSRPWFYAAAAVVFAVWWWLSFNLRRWSLLQDRAQAGEDGQRDLFWAEPVLVWIARRVLRNPMEVGNRFVLCSRMMRLHAAYGIYLFALTLTLAAVLWMKALEHQWFSTMYGVYYFAGSVWTALAMLYALTIALERQGPLSGVVHRRQIHDLGVLFFAFTVFYAYIAFSQYFLIWNAAIPEETYYYVKRETGSWWDLGLLLVFGHFLLPFLALLRIDAKLWLPLTIPLCAWAGLMHFCDLAFNIMPVLHPTGFHLHYLDLACLAFIGGVLALVFLKYFQSHPAYPVRDPRLEEAIGVHHGGPLPPATAPE